VELLLGRCSQQADAEGCLINTSALHYIIDQREERLLGIFKGNKHFDYNVRDGSNRTPLMLAANFGWSSAVNILLAEPRVDPDLIDDNGRTALMIAASSDIDGDVMLSLLSRTVNVNAREKSMGVTALMLAVYNGHQSTIGTMLTCDGADAIDVNVRDSSGRTALLLAVEGGSREDVILLINSEKVNVRMADDSGNTALHYAAQSSEFQHVLAVLTESERFDLGAKNHSGWTALDTAIVYGIPGAVQWLLHAYEDDPEVGLPSDLTSQARMLWHNNQKYVSSAHQQARVLELLDTWEESRESNRRKAGS
jgi:ankyrin repeat protein